MNQLQLYRKRFIPSETVYLKDDIVLVDTENLVISKWNCIKPRKDISHGISAYILDKGYKVCKVFNHNHQVVYWYCDIIESIRHTATNSLYVTDLLIDIVVYENGISKILDLNEIADALEQNLISTVQTCTALRCASSLLEEVYNGQFSYYQSLINAFDSTEPTSTNECIVPKK